MRLVGVEVRRLLARRLLRVLVLLVFLGLVFALAKTAWDSHPPTASEIAAAERQAELAREQSPPIEEQIADCESQKAAGQGPPPDFDCRAGIHEPGAADFLPDRTFRFRQAVSDRIVAFAGILALLGFVSGASFVGAEWSAGTIATLLTWEPRRIRVLLAKAVGLSVVLALAGGLVMAAAVGGHAAIAAWRGDFTGTTSGLLLSVSFTALRGVALGVGAGLIGFAIAGTTRHTSAALGIGFGYFLGAELLLRNLWKGSPPWLLTSNVGAWLVRNFHIDSFTCPPAGGECTVKSIQLSIAHGAAYLSVLVLAVLVVCAVSFRRRDVT